MNPKVANPDVGRLEELVLDLGEEVTGLVARTAAFEAYFRALGQDGETTVTYADPVSARVQARRRRIERSGLRVLDGGAR
jgi:hypothetical protein